jgi:mono/diheme cytochrome c family protein
MNRRVLFVGALLLGGALGAKAQFEQFEDDKDWVAPHEAITRVNPLAPSPESLKRGRSLYRQHCSTCHGDKGRGDGPYARMHTRRAKPPRDLTIPETQARLTDGEIFWKISTGLRVVDRIIMPAFDEDIRADEDRWRVVLYVRALGAGQD